METDRKTLTNVTPLTERAHNIRRNALRMGEVQGQGYIAQALDISDVLAVAYFHAMRYRPDDPSWDGRDRFLLSNGHYAIALYAALIEAGIVPEVELETYGSDESRLPMSGMASYTPGMEMSGGSLGLGLSIAVGMGLGLKRKGSTAKVYTLFSDGELDEGSVWEAIQSASHHKLDNVIGIIDVNNQQADVVIVEQGDGANDCAGWTLGDIVDQVGADEVAKRLGPVRITAPRDQIIEFLEQAALDC